MGASSIPEFTNIMIGLLFGGQVIIEYAPTFVPFLKIIGVIAEEGAWIDLHAKPVTHMVNHMRIRCSVVWNYCSRNILTLS